MFNFGGITHIIQFPTKRFGYVGSVPSTLADEVPATQADVMGGRAHSDEHGNLFAYKFRSHATVEDAVWDAKKNGAKLCESPTCACRSLFPVRTSKFRITKRFVAGPLVGIELVESSPVRFDVGTEYRECYGSARYVITACEEIPAPIS